VAAPGRQAHEAQQRAQRGRLAGTVGSEEADDAPGGHREGEVVDGERVAETLGEAADFDGV
jgi:hypothetical protein